ncbi:pyridoxamine 5'-phosphate oxidase family protein [Limnohabitans sp. 2KL-3]|jgi:predicted pyridoxine 5'-phosphate oxidase superfamily flavin-nucleotide-binding protein|uniref:pyridoxamine 5'-phosphate oxidase family protein n=1 Tax=Limnohabitans sp. 2KL-3 TaxID=1100700 RepID=UPI000AC44DE6|nr:pyridoxamine 5'-phosphate oxidase family protein [Limnohabitans sp. 2KL-3]
MTLLTEPIREAARRSVLCWLATVDAEGQPNVSPKEVWAIADDQHVVVAHIASPMSARNIAQHPQVCLSFVDVFVQKGFKLVGTAREVRAGDAEFATWAKPLLAMVGQRFTIQSVLVVHVQSVTAILAPSYRFYPHDTTEASQVASAMRAYKVQAVEKDKP